MAVILATADSVEEARAKADRAYEKLKVECLSTSSLLAVSAIAQKLESILNSSAAKSNYIQSIR
ncbi:hypothetical protein [Duncaniella dubosii]|uniref:hypothetical protein n=1 Tax=Duncaniella dubosii TaxID=2518971 RepID=UPI003F661A82